MCIRDRFQDASFEIHRGEILGFAGMVGAGRTELISSIFGLDRYTPVSYTHLDVYKRQGP